MNRKGCSEYESAAQRERSYSVFVRKLWWRRKSRAEDLKQAERVGEERKIERATAGRLLRGRRRGGDRESWTTGRRGRQWWLRGERTCPHDVRERREGREVWLELTLASRIDR